MNATSSVIIIVSSPLMALSSNSWPTVWVFLEVGSIGFVLFSYSQVESESPMTYFIVQSVASSFMLIFSTVESFPWPSNSLVESPPISAIILVAILISMGAFPLHQWIVNVGSLSSWNVLTPLLTIQSFSPSLLILLVPANLIPIIVAPIGVIAGVVAQASTSNINSIIVYSSIAHTGWVLFLTGSNSTHTFFYLIIYSFVVIMTIKQMNSVSIDSYEDQENQEKNAPIIFILLSLGGVPPLVGFILSWIGINCIVNLNNNSAIIMTMLAMSVLNAYIYIIIFMSSSSNTPNNSFNINNASQNSQTPVSSQVVPTPAIFHFAK